MRRKTHHIHVEKKERKRAVPELGPAEVDANPHSSRKRTEKGPARTRAGRDEREDAFASKGMYYIQSMNVLYMLHIFYINFNLV
jgi:hypothetical protein